MIVIEDKYILDRKKDMSRLGMALIAQGIIFNIAGLFISDIIKDEGVSIILTAILGILPLYLYTGKNNFKIYIKSERKKFTFLDLLVLFSIMMVLNTLASQIFNYIEVFLNLFGLSAVSEANSGEASATISMVMYGIIIAPIVEEVIYRGVLMRSLEKYGAYAAILISSILFGTMHQDLLQSPVTMFVGLTLAYAAYKYSIKLSIILHILNNLTVEMGAQLDLSKGLEGSIFNIVINLLISVTFVIFVFKNRKKIKRKIQDIKEKYLKIKEKNKELKIKGSIKVFFTRKSVIILLAIDLIIMFAGIGVMK
ncbi:MAG: type II CAAX endopeptidase family protein [Peptostreptococcus sp.]|uniref:CPBP family intramembrane glutamic endopeptidase n=1 Tax=Peptostreptococcus sp. TaxID=1262 RepID=UPI002FCC0D2D